MGRRKKHAPKHGSLAYLPRGRAASHIGKIKFWPEIEVESPVLLSFAGFKSGMSHVYILSEHRGSPTFGQEVFTSVTLIETPPMLVCGIRAYKKTGNGLKSNTEVWMKNLPKNLKGRISTSKISNTDQKMKEIEKRMDNIAHLHLILCTQPQLAAIPQKKPDIMEGRIGGGTLEKRFEYAKKILGREVNVSNVFTEGQFIDVVAVTKGKGVQGPVKRWGIKRKQHKSNKTVREVACIGPWNPAYVMYSIPRAGQMGFHHRTERNKQILKISVKGENGFPSRGFPHYGTIKNDFMIIKGSIPGTAKRLIRLRYTARTPVQTSESAPKITAISTKSRS
jgi:large subunit ribosomal protein L3